MILWLSFFLPLIRLRQHSDNIDISNPGANFVPKATPLICLSVLVGLVQSGAEKEYPSSVL